MSSVQMMLLLLSGRHRAAVIVVIALLVVTSTAASKEPSSVSSLPSTSGQTTFRLCGDHIPRMLSFVCGSRGYHNPFKRTSPALPVAGKRHHFVALPSWLSSRYHRIHTRGIIDECCTNPCTLTNLESYCARPATISEARRVLEGIPMAYEAVTTTTTEVPAFNQIPFDFEKVAAQEEEDEDEAEATPLPSTPPSGGTSGRGHAQHYFFDYHTYPPDTRWNVIIRKGR